MSLYVAAYDIGDDRRRTRVARVLFDYGHRVQESVFELFLDPDDVLELRRRLGPLLAVDDEFAIFPIDQRGTRRRIRWQAPPESWGPVLLR